MAAVKMFGKTSLSHATKPAGGRKKQRPWSSAGGRKVKLTLYDPDNVQEKISITNLKFRRAPEGQSKVKAKLHREIQVAEQVAEQATEPAAEEPAAQSDAQPLPAQLLDAPEHDTAALSTAGASSLYKAYFKMLKVGVPLPAVLAKAAGDGLDADVVAAVLAAGPDASLPPTTAKQSSSSSLISHLSEKLGAISDSHAQAAYSNYRAPSPSNTPAPAARAMIKLKDDSRYEKYFKKLKVGVPLPAVVQSAVGDGLDFATIEAVLLQDPEGLVPVHVPSPTLIISIDAPDAAPRRTSAYTPKSPLNVKSGMLNKALKKGQARLRKSTIVMPLSSGESPAGESPAGEGGLRQVASRDSVKDGVDKEEVKREVSDKLMEGIVEFCVGIDKVLHAEEIIVASNATVFGVGRFGKVVKGMIRTKKVVRRRKESIIDKHRERSFRKMDTEKHLTQGKQSSIDGNEEKANAGGSLTHHEHQIEESVNMAVKIVQHNHPFMPVPLAKNTLHELRSLARCAGECVVSLYGVAVTSPTLCIVTPLYNQGSLYALVRSKEWGKLSSKVKFKLYYELAIGLNTVHQSNTVHADVKSHNMLVHCDREHDTWSAAVGDLGSAMFLEKKDEKVFKEQGTCGWTAPEVFTGEGYGMSSDIFSFGLVLCDSACNGSVNPGWPGSMDSYVNRLKEGERPPLPVADGSGLSQIVQFCWKFEPEARPSSGQVMTRMGEILDSM